MVRDEDFSKIVKRQKHEMDAEKLIEIELEILEAESVTE